MATLESSRLSSVKQSSKMASSVQSPRICHDHSRSCSTISSRSVSTMTSRSPSTSSRDTHYSSLLSNSQVSSYNSIPPWHTIKSSFPTEVIPDYDLPCEFGFLGCVARFHSMEWESWISHSLSHFGIMGPPNNATCTFCGKKAQQEAQWSDERVSSSSESKWRRRMLHIGGHFGNKPSTLQFTPDYNVLQYMLHNDLITNEDFGMAMKCIRPELAISSKWQDERLSTRYWGLQAQRDLEWEDRWRRRSEKEKKKEPKGHAGITENPRRHSRNKKREIFIINRHDNGSRQDSRPRYDSSTLDVILPSESISEPGDHSAFVSPSNTVEPGDRDDETDSGEENHSILDEDDVFPNFQGQSGSILDIFALSSDTKATILRQCVAKYNSLIQKEHPGVQFHGTPESSSGTSGTQSSCISFSTAEESAMKRPRGKNNSTEPNETANRLPDQPERGKEPMITQDESPVFACPFRKRNPQKYCIQSPEWRNCALKEHKSIARVKGHLERKHMIYQCPRCKVVLPTEDELYSHGLSNEGCPMKDAEPLDGVTTKMWQQVKSRKRAHPGETEKQKWERMYELLFPGEEVPSPYFEPVADVQVESMADLEVFIYPELRRMFATALQTIGYASGEPVDCSLQAKILAMLDKSQEDAIAAFHSNTQARSKNLNSSPSSPGVVQPALKEFGSASCEDQMQVLSMSRDTDSGYVTNSSRSENTGGLRSPKLPENRHALGDMVSATDSSGIFTNGFTTHTDESACNEQRENHDNDLDPLSEFMEYDTNFERLSQDINWEAEFTGAWI